MQMNENQDSKRWWQSSTDYDVEHVFVEDERAPEITDAWVVHYSAQCLFITFTDGFTYWCEDGANDLVTAMNDALDACAHRRTLIPKRSGTFGAN